MPSRSDLRFVGLLAGLATAGGCGDSDRHTTGTVVEVTRDMEAEAKASDAFITSQSKTKKKATPTPTKKDVPDPAPGVPK